MTMTILRIDSSARTEGSVTRDLLDRIEARLDGPVTRRDVGGEALPQITGTWVASNFTPAAERTPEQAAALALSDDLIAELEAADTVLIGLPIYNFGVPASLKAWIDLVARAGITFRYTETGPEGLLKGKRAIVAVASGGTRMGSDVDYASGYLRHVLGFLGIEDVQFVAADEQAVKGEESVAEARAEVQKLAA
ncbi:FMN-dependent NADH-azoreductase [Jannaschia ovalis]|uniref:FMN dependent NADH:quinone oxidoreductase n=1 Tax=Jannaschia ovalis TaxID=3038773 RepID=A0ABY8LIR0_9RHOB|nr:NAD(P)H-dependent oxidoreductase [Jannaschia sp. GRR-S6-38]WGH79993.1 NAD(P)H-dependent oxidoreductase [Jannaschia sp. GRR-S6-38]